MDAVIGTQDVYTDHRAGNQANRWSGRLRGKPNVLTTSRLLVNDGAVVRVAIAIAQYGQLEVVKIKLGNDRACVESRRSQSLYGHFDFVFEGQRIIHGLAGVPAQLASEENSANS